LITLLKNCRVIDPAHQKDGVIEDIYISDGKIIAKPGADASISKTYDLKHKVVMSGAIDMHSHIGGGKVNIARMLCQNLEITANQKPIYALPIAIIMLPPPPRKLAFATLKWAIPQLLNLP
jgi:formylmethanofuran dehydrogenase subunit A